jgi:hypothetical protein
MRSVIAAGATQAPVSFPVIRRCPSHGVVARSSRCGPRKLGVIAVHFSYSDSETGTKILDPLCAASSTTPL